MLLLTVLLTGCLSAPHGEIDIVGHKADISESINVVSEVKDSVTSNANTIITVSTDPVISESANTIKTEVKRLDVVASSLSNSLSILALNKKLADLNKELISSTSEKQTFIWISMLAVSAFMISIGIGLISFKFAGTGIPLLVTGIGSAVLSKAMITHGELLSIVGLVIIVVIVVAFIYKAYISKKALEEVVTSVSAVRSKPLDGKSWKDSEVLIDIIQSESTKRIVKDIKTNIVNK